VLSGDELCFAKVREGFDQWLERWGLPGGLTAIWVRERLSGGSAEVVHCHMLFHLPHLFTRVRKRVQVESALERLIGRHGEGTTVISRSSSHFLAIRMESIC
jgi:hypothetical protein